MWVSGDKKTLQNSSIFGIIFAFYLFFIYESLNETSDSLYLNLTRSFVMLSNYLQTGFYGKKYSNKFPGDKCHGRPSTIPRMVAHHPKDGHPPEENLLQW